MLPRPFHLLALFSGYLHETTQLLTLTSRILKITSRPFTEGPALQQISNVSYYHATRLNINLCLGSQARDCKCLQWASFPRPITPPHNIELNFTPVMVTICSEENQGMCLIQQICVAAQPSSFMCTGVRTLYSSAATHSPYVSQCLADILAPNREMQ